MFISLIRKIHIAELIGMREAAIYLLAVTIAEAVTVIIHPVWGIVSHIVILLATLLQSAIASEHDHRRQLVLSLALVPLVRIISLSLPLANIPTIWWYPTVYAPLLAAALMVIRILGYRLNDIGLNFRLFPLQLAIALTGLLFGVAEYLILRPESPIAELTWNRFWPMALIYLTSTGFVEEFIFRGVMQKASIATLGSNMGIVYVSLLFAVVHLVHYATVGLKMVLIDLAFVFVVALFFSWIVKKTGSLFGVTLAHGITNSLLYLVAPFFF